MSGRPRVVVVGAGIAGLTVAGALGTSARSRWSTDCPPPAGAGYDHPAVRDEVALPGPPVSACAWARPPCAGSTPASWLPGRPGSSGCRSIASSTPVGRGRPCHPSFRLLGPRVAGVTAATVAVHFAEAEVAMGRSVCLLGVSDWAERAARILRHKGARVTGVSTDEGPPPVYGDQWWIGWRPVAIEGTRRVTAVVVARGESRQRITCDTLILAGDSRPLRNVDGAIADAPGVDFAQRTEDRQSIEEVRRHSLEIAGQIRDQLAAR